jgi:hypothetical protein
MEDFVRLLKMPPFGSGRTRGALGPGEPSAHRAGGLAGWGARPPPQLAYKSGWPGLSGPGTGGGQLCRACPSARRGRVSIREETFPYITICCVFIEIGTLVRSAFTTVRILGASVHIWNLEVVVKEVEPYIINIAREIDLLEVLYGGTTDAVAIAFRREGIPVAALSIPTRYVHSPAELLDVRDAVDAATLLRHVDAAPVIDRS